MDHKVFISYSSQDAAVAERIYDRLERNGIPCWISSKDVPPGADFQSCIVEAIAHAQLVLLVFSSEANQSGEIAKELALASKKLLIPTRIEDVLPEGAFKYQLTNRQFVDLFEDFDNRLDELSHVVQAALEGRPYRPSATQRNAPIASPPRSPPVTPPPVPPVPAPALAAASSMPTPTPTPAPVRAATQAPASNRSALLAIAAIVGIAVLAIALYLIRATQPEPTDSTQFGTNQASAVEETSGNVADTSKHTAPTTNDDTAKASAESSAPLPMEDAAIEAGEFEPATSAPSFNCARASQASEKMVCNNAELAALDRSLDTTYKAMALQVAAYPEILAELKRSQLEWLHQRNACTDEACVAEVYAERIEDLSGSWQ